MNKTASSLALTFFVASTPSQAWMEDLPGNICIVKSGIATLYYQVEDNGVYAPAMQSSEKLMKAGYLQSLFGGRPLEEKQQGEFSSPAKQYNYKTGTWTKPSSGTVKVHIDRWSSSQQAEGRCTAEGSYALSAYIVKSDAYLPLKEGMPILRHQSVDPTLINMSAFAKP